VIKALFSTLVTSLGEISISSNALELSADALGLLDGVFSPGLQASWLNKTKDTSAKIRHE
jgi:hypothetical protein